MSRRTPGISRPPAAAAPADLAPPEVASPPKASKDATPTATESEPRADRVSRREAFVDGILALAPAMAVSFVMCVLITALALWVYDKRRSQVFAVVDLPGIVELEQLRLTVTAVAPGLSETARQGLLSDAQAFGDRLAKEIETLRAQCGCVLLTTSAFVGEPPADYTTTLKSRLGLDKLNADMLRKQAQSRLEAAIPALAQPQAPGALPQDRALPLPAYGGSPVLPPVRP